jgi:hypothetical protein
MKAGAGLIRPNDPTIDFCSIATRRLAFEGGLGRGRITLQRGAFIPCEGVNLSSSDMSVVMNHRKPFRLECRVAESDRLISHEMRPGHAHIAGGQFGFWFRSQAAPTFFAFSMDRSFVRRVCEGAFGAKYEIANALSVADPAIARLCKAVPVGASMRRVWRRLWPSGFCAVMRRRWGGSTSARAVSRHGGYEPCSTMSTLI